MFFKYFDINALAGSSNLNFMSIMSTARPCTLSCNCVYIIVLQKVRKQGIRFWDERTFWHEMIYKSLIHTFGKPSYVYTEVSQK